MTNPEPTDDGPGKAIAITVGFVVGLLFTIYLISLYS